MLDKVKGIVKAEVIKDARKKALEVIEASVAECETSGDYNYTLGLLEMAFSLDIITLNERANYNDKACNNYQNHKKNKGSKRVD